MSSLFFKLLNLFKSRLSQHIVIWVFASIVFIESVILIPSYFNRKRELLSQLEEVSKAVLQATVRWRQQGMTGVQLIEKVKTVTDNSVILGITIYHYNGQLIQTIGEPPEITFSDLSNIEVYGICGRRWDGDHYDVAWSARQLGTDYILIVRHDASSIQPKLYAYTLRIAGLVLVISIFVTGTTMLVLGATVIVPILRLRDDLIAAGEALAQDKANLDFYSFSIKRKDELGEVMEAFKQMFQRVSREIAERKQAEQTLRAEQDKSERLLLNILPKPIAQRLKEGQNNIADNFTDVTILFADIVGFTQLSERKLPSELVKLLNEIFSEFDRLSEKHGLEKIKTIGDAYMVVGGLPMPRQDHTEAIAEMALDMQQAITRLSGEYSEVLSIRIGINTGPVVAGVIGTKKFIYDLWGDAVNTANRMESHGLPGCIQVTDATYARLQDKYLFQERGRIPIKGKGEMTTYLLIGRKVPESLI